MMFSGETFRSLQSRNFRLFMTSQVVSMTGIWMQRMATVWLVLSLTDSPFLSSANDFASQIPILVLGLFSGALIDRVDKKHLIQVTQFMLLLIALLMGFLTLSQRASYPIILLSSWSASFWDPSTPSTCPQGRRASARWSIVPTSCPMRSP